MCCCCCCPPAISALFCLWVQSGCSKSSVAGALTFFPPEPPLYEFERQDDNGNRLPDDNGDKDGNDLHLTSSTDAQADGNGQQIEDPTHRTGETKERMQSPAQQLVDRAKELRELAKIRNARDARDHAKGVKFKLRLDPRLAVPPYDENAVEAVKIPAAKNGIHVAAVIYRITATQSYARSPPKQPQYTFSSDDDDDDHDIAEADSHSDNNNEEQQPEEPPKDRPQPKTIIYSHGNATDIGAMFPLQAVLAHSLDCNVVMYDYSGFGESGGVPLEPNTYRDIEAVYQYTLEHVANNDPSSIILYGQSVGGGPCCHLALKDQKVGGMILHSAFTSGMRVLTPSR